MSTRRVRGAMAPRDAEEVVLHYGDNGQHEFYEGGQRNGRAWLIIRNYSGEERTPREKWHTLWAGQAEDESVVSGDTAEHVMRKLAEVTGLRFRVNANHEYRYPGAPLGASPKVLRGFHSHMRLYDVDTGEQVDYDTATRAQRAQRARLAGVHFEAVW